jgi:hypothetical protein
VFEGHLQEQVFCLSECAKGVVWTSEFGILKSDLITKVKYVLKASADMRRSKESIAPSLAIDT